MKSYNNISKKLLGGLVAAVLSLTLFGLSARAQILENESFTYIFPNPISTSDSGGSSLAFNLYGFNPSLGTLTAVSINMALNTSVNMGAFDPFGGGSFTNGGTSYTISLTGPSSITPLYISPAIAQIGISATVNGLYEAPATLGSLTVTNVSDPNLATYVNGGQPLGFNVSLSAAYGSGNPTPNNGNINFLGEGSVNGSTTITYSYEAAPEPSTSGLLLGGLGLLAFWHLRKCRTQI